MAARSGLSGFLTRCRTTLYAQFPAGKAGLPEAKPVCAVRLDVMVMMLTIF